MPFGYSPRLMRSCYRALGALSVLGALLACPAGAAPTQGSPDRAEAARAGVPDPAAARAYVATILPSPELQAFLDRTVAEIGRDDPRLLSSGARIAVIDLTRPAAPRIAHVRGHDKVYPASTVKFVYLMAAYAWQERGRLRIDASLDTELSAMIRESSNQATRKVFARLTDTEPGPELDSREYAVFRERRLLVKQWLETMGIDDLHTVNPTYDGDGDLFGRDQQFLRDRSVSGGLPVTGSQFGNRTAMTASGTARLLALLATDRALTPADSATVRQRMRRDVREQPHLVHRIAGGASTIEGAEVFSKSGTWGPIYADAGIVRDRSGREFVIAMFTDASPPYRGDAIANLVHRLAVHLFASAPAAPGGAS
jgi:beta-lactamase class A